MSRVPLVDLAGAFEPGSRRDEAAWTNDRWVSTLHRVVTPTGDLGDRISIAFFHQPTYDARIECIPTCTTPDDPPRYEPTTSGGWILSMIERTLY